MLQKHYFSHFCKLLNTLNTGREMEWNTTSHLIYSLSRVEQHFNCEADTIELVTFNLSANISLHVVLIMVKGKKVENWN